MYGVTTNGFVIKRLSDIKSEVEEALRAGLGNGINLLPEAVLGQIVGIFSERESLIWELAEAVYNSQYPDTAEGVSLENVGSITGITKLNPIASIVKSGVAYGTPGTLIENGFTVSVKDSPDLKFKTNTDYVIGTGGSVENIELVATKTGKIIAPANSLTEIETPVAGVDSFTNLEDAIVGRGVETDAEFKIRRKNALQVAGAGTLEAIRSNLLNIKDVIASVLFENREIVVDGYGRPPKSFEAVILGGVEQELADVIWNTKPPGIETHGSVMVEVYDSQGYNHFVKFSRPTEIDIYIELDLTVDINFPATGIDLVKSAVIGYAQTLSIGDDVIVYPKLISSMNDIPGLLDIVIRIGITPSPALDDNIIIDQTEISSFDTSRILVTIL